jgi:hypothetical protein
MNGKFDGEHQLQVFMNIEPTLMAITGGLSSKTSGTTSAFMG